MNESCKTIRPRLVDYGDGALPAEQSASIAAHLADCADCRAELRLLVESLSFAKELWQEAASPRPTNDHASRGARSVPGEGPGVRANQFKKLPARQKALAVGLALCATIAVVAIGLSLFSPGKPPSTVKKTNPSPPPKVEVVRSDPQEIDVMEYIAREGRAARLAASMQMLAAEPSLKEYKDSAERYLRENYADTTAVKMLGQQ
ncbi:MAG: zf-HC2 domain-containing protein [Pirellulales bacterium]|nr:zf-HC2 domain-containing protein [Pirellulales bacterium]